MELRREVEQEEVPERLWRHRGGGWWAKVKGPPTDTYHIVTDEQDNAFGMINMEELRQQIEKGEGAACAKSRLEAALAPGDPAPDVPDVDISLANEMVSLFNRASERTVEQRSCSYTSISTVATDDDFVEIMTPKSIF